MKQIFYIETLKSLKTADCKENETLSNKINNCKK